MPMNLGGGGGQNWTCSPGSSILCGEIFSRVLKNYYPEKAYFIIILSWTCSPGSSILRGEMFSRVLKNYYPEKAYFIIILRHCTPPPSPFPGQISTFHKNISGRHVKAQSLYHTCRPLATPLDFLWFLPPQVFVFHSQTVHPDQDFSPNHFSANKNIWMSVFQSSLFFMGESFQFVSMDFIQCR
jgi:hypothetical protein